MLSCLRLASFRGWLLLLGGFTIHEITLSEKTRKHTKNVLHPSAFSLHPYGGTMTSNVRTQTHEPLN